MNKQEKSPDANEAPKKSDSQISLIDLAEEYYQAWLPALSIESTRFLGKRLSIAQAELAFLVRDNELLRASNKNLHDRVLHLELGYSQLCDAHDQNKKIHHEIGVRQKNHIQICDKNFTKIQDVLKRMGA
tara:strand:+ start:537 stop:926 length:390 start_codon:yes stop_codon:yes gene_type:complete